MRSLWGKYRLPGQHTHPYEWGILILAGMALLVFLLGGCAQITIYGNGNTVNVPSMFMTTATVPVSGLPGIP